jgi:hypothetical protein
MVVGCVLTVSLTCFVLTKVWRIESIQRSVIALFAYLPLVEIARTQSFCALHLSQIAEGSFIKAISSKTKKL